SKEYTGFITQKPISLLERVIDCASEPGDLVADFFCGSGTTAVAAQHLGRNWVVSDLSDVALGVTRERLMAINGARWQEMGK
ncbi:MAG: DNA methyltransferase, partial [Candidatus Thorarchaeota archaeon]